MDPETDDVACWITDETPKAYRLKTDTHGEAWFPKSETVFKRRNMKTGDAVAELPLWLLRAKGWD